MGHTLKFRRDQAILETLIKPGEDSQRKAYFYFLLLISQSIQRLISIRKVLHGSKLMLLNKSVNQ